MEKPVQRGFCRFSSWWPFSPGGLSVGASSCRLRWCFCPLPSGERKKVSIFL